MEKNIHSHSDRATFRINEDKMTALFTEPLFGKIVEGAQVTDLQVYAPNTHRDVEMANCKHGDDRILTFVDRGVVEYTVSYVGKSVRVSYMIEYTDLHPIGCVSFGAFILVDDEDYAIRKNQIAEDMFPVEIIEVSEEKFKTESEEILRLNDKYPKH